jgi:rare lipoprotein A
MFQHKLKSFTFIFSFFFLTLGGTVYAQKSNKTVKNKVVLDTAKTKIVIADTIKPKAVLKLKVFKTKAHASYYANKFNGKRTSSGVRFDNDKYTAAHRKLPFGTKLKITNEENGKSVIVEVIDRGPFSRGREIDLSKRAFMEIVSNKNSGSTKVTIETIE